MTNAPKPALQPHTHATKKTLENRRTRKFIRTFDCITLRTICFVFFLFFLFFHIHFSCLRIHSSSCRIFIDMYSFSSDFFFSVFETRFFYWRDFFFNRSLLRCLREKNPQGPLRLRRSFLPGDQDARRRPGPPGPLTSISLLYFFFNNHILIDNFFNPLTVETPASKIIFIISFS